MDYDHLGLSEATRIQNELRGRIGPGPMRHEIRTVAGADISFNKYETAVYAGIVVLKFPELVPLAHALVKVDVYFPYVPGYLAFREVPALLRAWELLPEKPGVLVVDGHGTAHPRGMGIAAHFGALTGQCTVGCAKNILCGKFEDPPPQKGSASPIIYKDAQVGWALRSKDRVNPVFVSPGNGMDMDDSLQLMRRCLGRYRIPEPTRLAHEAVNRFRTGALAEGYRAYDDGLFML